MSHEGIVMVSRVAVIAVLIALAAFVRVLVGPSRKRGLRMGIGTLGGISAGIAVASLVSRWVATDVSATCALLGMVAGWAVAWPFARRIPREAP